MKAVADVLSDPENGTKTAEEVAELAIEALDDTRARSHRIAVVGQITHGPQDETSTVVLGPFSSRGVLDTEEKFQRATEGGTAARDAGQHLAWDVRTGTGRGQFMLVPVFRNARDAWEFHRGRGPAETIADAVTTHRPPHLGPVCACGLADTGLCRWCSTPYTRHCPLHEPQAEPHRCTRAA